MWNWFLSLFKHPKTTIAGIGALAGAAALGYGMSTGAVPIDTQTIATAGGLASAGIAGIAGKDAVPLKSVIESVAPAVDLVQQYQNMAKEAQTAQDKLNGFAAVTQALAEALPADKK
jgi:hypothetical protein